MFSIESFKETFVNETFIRIVKLTFEGYADIRQQMNVKVKIPRIDIKLYGSFKSIIR